MKIWQRILIIVGIAFLAVVLILLIALPGIIRNYIEKHDQELIGREITIQNIDVNYFTATLEIDGFDMKEADGETSFLSFNRMYAEAHIWSLFKKHIVIKKYHLDGAVIRVEQDGPHFNFDDLLALVIESDTAGVEKETDEAEPWHITMQDVDLRRNTLYYESDLHPLLSFESVRVQVPVASDTSRLIVVDISLDLSTGGSLKLHNVLDLPNSYYNVDLIADRLDLNIMEPYVEPFLEITGLEGFFSSNFLIGGSWDNTNIFNLGGSMAIDQFNMLDKRSNSVIGLDHGEINIDSVRMDEGYYRVNKVLVDGFSGIFERYIDGDNFSNMMIEYEYAPVDSLLIDSVRVEPEIDYSNPISVMSYYLKDIVKSYDESSYKIGEIEVKNSNFNFNDYATSDPFRYELIDMALHADSLSSFNESMTFDFGATLNKTGRFEGYLKLFTANLSDLDLHYEIIGTDLTAFSPYTTDFVDYPISAGDVQYVSDTKIRNGQLVSSNIITCSDFRWGNPAITDPLYKLPVKLAVGLLKDVDGNINLDVPVEGNIHDPSFKIGKIIWNTLKNLVLKVVAAPFKLMRGIFGFDVQELKRLDFNLLQYNLLPEQKRQLKGLAAVMNEKPDLNVEFKRVTKKYEELERFAVSASKYEYLKGEKPPEALEVSKEVYQEIVLFNTLDSSFAAFIDQQIPESERDLPIQKKCMVHIGEEHALEQTDKLGAKRNHAISEYLISDQGIDSTRVRIIILPEDSLITHRSNSIYYVDFWVEE